MNKRTKKKKLHTIIRDINKVSLKEDEILLIKYDMNTSRPHDLEKFAGHIRSKISNQIFFIPNTWDMQKVLVDLSSNNVGKFMREYDCQWIGGSESK